MALRWGILSAGKISTDFAKAITILPENEHILTAVAARDLERAHDFAKKFSIPKAYGNYEELAKDSNVDVVYIGCVHPQHFKTAKMMLEHGKHVLCEKPMTMNEKQTKKLVLIAREKGKFLMEAVWSRYFPAYSKLKELIQEGAIGNVKYVSVHFGKKINHVDRLNKKELGGGTVLDLGVYALQFQQFIFDGESPETILASGHLNQFGTDESANIIMKYKDGKSAVLSTHAAIDFKNIAIVVGDKGTIKVPYHWRPIKLITPSGEINFDLPQSRYDSMRPAGMSYEVAEVGRCIKAGLLESPKMTHVDSLQLASWMDEVRRQIGVVYPEDSKNY